MNLVYAFEAIKAGVRASQELGTRMNIAIVDNGGNLKAFVREDDAWIGSIDIATKKAKTSVFFAMDTAILGELSQPGNDLYGIEHSNGGLITFAGGLPIIANDGTINGGVGVSGSSIDNDKKVAEAVVQAYLSYVSIEQNQ
jgi:uncharacterized protein GlcG (DUF336 family)